MAKRLQVILRDPDYREYKCMARARHMSMAEWVRQAPDEARRRQPAADVERKLAAIREAAQYNFPAPGIEVLLAEIERGYLSDREPGERP